MKNTCEQRVGSIMTGRHVCGKPATMTHEDRAYCGIHDPVKRKDKADARYAEARALDQHRFEVQEAKGDLVRAALDAAPESLPPALREAVAAYRSMIGK